MQIGETEKEEKTLKKIRSMYLMCVCLHVHTFGARTVKLQENLKVKSNR